MSCPQIQTCAPLGAVPSISEPELCIKAGYSGITFFSTYDIERKKYFVERPLKSRYTGSESAAVSINGVLFTDKKELDKLIKQEGENFGKSRKGKKKPGVALPGKIIKSTYKLAGVPVQGAIYPDFFVLVAPMPKKPKKLRKKLYKVDKPKVRARIMAYINTQKGKNRLFFWTVSFPEGSSDDACYQAFNTWLTALRQRNLLKEYLWIAERQTGERLTDKTKTPTNTIHFHIAIPHYLDVNKANGTMRGILKNLAKKGLIPGAIGSVKNKAVYFTNSIKNYNGVDIAKHRKTRKPINFAVKKGSVALANYLTKYVTKNNAGIPDKDGNIAVPGFEHLAWHNSRGFSDLFTAVAFSIPEFKALNLGFFLNRTRRYMIQNFAVFIPWINGPPPAIEQHLFNLNSYLQTLNDETNRQRDPGVAA